MSTIKDRLKQFISYNNMSGRAFEKTVGMSNGYIRSVTDDIKHIYVVNIMEKFPTLNTDWLLTGKGSMLIDKNTVNVENVNNIIDNTEDCYCDVEELNEEACRFALPFVSTEIAQNRSVDVKGLVLSGADKLERRSVRSFLGRDVNYMQKVITNAMAPIFLPGDVLFLRFLSNVDEMLDGAIHLIDTRIYGTMVRQVSREGGVYILRSANPDFKAVRLDEDMIYSASLIVGSLRTSFNMPANSINNSEVINKQTDQISKLIDEVILQNKRMHDKEDKTQSLVDRVISRLDKI